MNLISIILLVVIAVCVFFALRSFMRGGAKKNCCKDHCDGTCC